MRVLVINPGSSSLKLRVLDGELSVLGSDDLELRDGVVQPDAVARALADLPDADAARHRVAHGGAWYSDPS